MSEPVLNENGIQEFQVTPMNPYYLIRYRINDNDNDVHDFCLYTDYGQERLWTEFKRQIDFLIETRPEIHKVEVLNVWEYFQQEVHYRKAWVGDRAPFVSYDSIRNPVPFKPWILYIDKKCADCQWNYNLIKEPIGIRGQGYCYMLEKYNQNCEIGRKS